MRPYLLAAALLAVPALPAAAEDTCLIQVDRPYGRDDVMHVRGSMTCTAPFPGMSVTVCLESLKPASGTVGWVVEDCNTAYAAPGATTVSASLAYCVGGGPAVVRGTATAVDQAGRPVSGTSAPTVIQGMQNCF